MKNANFKPYNPVAIANYFVIKAKDDKAKLDLLKLVKLVYLAYGWSLVILNQRLIDEAPEVWPYGPVCPTVYHTFKKWSNKKTISHTERFYDMTENKWTTPAIKDDEISVKRLLDTIWKMYYDLSGVDLSNLTHQEGSAWSVTKEENHGLRNCHISDNLIKEEFTVLNNLINTKNNIE